MKKSHLITGVIYSISGLLFLILALRTESRLESIYCGLAGAGIGPGLMMIYRYFYWNRPENQQRYQEKLENERIEMHDELKSKLRDRAGRYAYIIGTLAISVSMFVFSILDKLEIIDDCRLIILFLAGFIVFQFIVYITSFKKLLNKF